MTLIFDISRPLHDGMPVWPGDAPFETGWSGRIAEGEMCNVGRMSLSLHCGTHLDAPYHIVDDGGRIAGSGSRQPASLRPFVGDAQVISQIGEPVVTVDALRARFQAGASRVLLRTDSFPVGQFNRKYTWLSPDAARFLADAGVVLIGIDTPSVDPFDSERLEAHHVLATAGVYILEGLDLSRIDDGIYELIALPLRLVDMDASPVRAVLRTG